MNKYFLLGAIAVISMLIMAFCMWARITHFTGIDNLKTIMQVCQITGTAALFVLLVLWLKKKK